MKYFSWCEHCGWSQQSNTKMVECENCQSQDTKNEESKVDEDPFLDAT